MGGKDENRLPGDCKIEGKSYEEASRILGVSISTVNEHIVKASQVVRKYFMLSTNIS